MSAIIFYSMGQKCGHCVNAENKTLKKEIAAGKVKVVPASQAPQGLFAGFPAFKSEITGKTSMGAPSSYAELCEKLGHSKENFEGAPLTFYSMKRCGYCQKAKKMFASELASGEMVQKDASDAPDGVRGFPTFKSNKTGKMHSGLPKSKADLLKKLGHSKENFEGAPITFFPHERVWILSKSEKDVCIRTC